MKIIAQIALGALALLVTAHVVPGIFISGLYIAIIASVVLGLLNALVRPVLIILTLPITVLTLGLFIFIINALLFYFASTFITGFEVNDLFSALIGSLLVSIITTVGNRFIK